MRSKYTSQAGTEALFNEADTAFAGQNEGDDLANGMPVTEAFAKHGIL